MAHILAIDDDRAVLNTVKIALESAGHRVVLAEDGTKGLQQFQNEKFDLLLIDIFMPGMDGIETMNMVHQDHPDMPIIVMSGHEFRLAPESAPDFLHMAIKLGAIASLKKPFRASELLNTVSQCLIKAQSLSASANSLRQPRAPD